MFVYLSKKIAIPNNVRLNCIAWNQEEGYIAVCGTEGLLKVLKLEPASNGQAKGGLAVVTNLSMNQTLDGHKEAVKVVTWNDKQQKLTSSDMDGVIIVWQLYKGSWYEEMTNDRKKSTVNGMSWTSDGSKICIVYEDGAIIVGSVDGNRIWGKELKNTHLTNVQWSPNNSLLLFGLASGECHLYDSQGNFALKLNIQCVSMSPNRHFRIAALHWFSKRAATNRPILAICYECGKVQIMRNENDESPTIFDTTMRIADGKWNHDGSVLAICGSLTDILTTSKEANEVNFYTPNGNLLRVLKVPGTQISSVSWEGRSLRIAMAVDSHIYFANIRPEYIWCYFEKTVVFLKKNSGNNNIPGGSNTRDSNINVITFWNTISNQSFLKEVEPAICMSASNEHCVIAVECINGTIRELDQSSSERKGIDDKCYQLLLCNSIGTTVDSKYTDLRPIFIGINSGYVAIASYDEILLWHYHTPKNTLSIHSVKVRKEKRFHIDDTPTGVDMAKDLILTGNYDSKHRENRDPICALALSEKLLLIARISGDINEYTVPNVALRNRHQIGTKIHKIAINCNSTRAAIIDHAGIMTLLDLDESHESRLNFNRVERKDVWAICWARDNPLLLALMEKTRMYVFRGNDPEEPISTSGYICTFEDLEITSVLLDDIISDEETQNPITHLIQLRVKSLRDTDDLLQHVGLDDAKQFIEDNPHPRLWRLLAEAALKKLDLDTAENAFVRCANYPGIQLIKRLRNITSAMLQRAEIAAFYGEYDEAEKLYMDGDRRDLAINLRIMLCDWFRVVQLYRMGSGISDQQMETAWREIGNHFANLRTWESAKEYYEKAHYMEGLMNALYHLEQFEELEECIKKLPEKSPLLAKIAQMLASVGMCSEAVSAYLKFGDPKAAVDICVNLRQWSIAVELAQKYQMPQVDTLLTKHVTELITDDRLIEAVELQKKAGRYLEAARLLMKLAEREAEQAEQDTSPLPIKKLYVLAGLIAEQQIKSSMDLDTEMGQHIDRNTILDAMNLEDIALIERIWHCAEAYHFMILAQRQLNFGLLHNAVVTILRLRDYDDVINVEDIYCLLALASCGDRSFATCSKAFAKLDSLDHIPQTRQQAYEDLASSIFSKHEKIDEKVDTVECYVCRAQTIIGLPSCTACNARFPACISSGQPITQPTSNIWICGTCHHCALPNEISRYRTCPLCHSIILALK